MKRLTWDGSPGSIFSAEVEDGDARYSVTLAPGETRQFENDVAAQLLASYEAAGVAGALSEEDVKVEPMRVAAPHEAPEH